MSIDGPDAMVLAGLLAGDVALHDEVTAVVGEKHLDDPTLRTLYGHMRTYRSTTGGVLTPAALDDLTADVDRGTAALLTETYNALLTARPTPEATRWAVSQLREQHERWLTLTALRDAQEIASGRVTEEPDARGRPGRTWSGVSDAREWMTARLTEIERESGKPSAVGRTIRVTAASAVVPRRLRWLWDRRIVLGGLTLLAGREGLGKSTVAVDLAAHVTNGTLDGEHKGEPRSVIYVHTEDARDYTVVPRLIAAGADLDRVIFVDMMTATDAGDAESPIVLPTDVSALAETVAEHGAVLVVLDAATSVIDSRLDGDRDRQMRQGLEAIARGVGERTGAAVLGIVHFGKRESADTGKLILGSIAWSQVARSVLAVARDDETQELVVSPGKANLGAPAPSVGARIVSVDVPTPDGMASVGRVEWTGETDRDARDLLGETRADPEERAERSSCAEWLEAWLYGHNDERAESKVVKTAARDAGFSERTLARARQSIGVVVATEGFPRASYWSLPPRAHDDDTDTSGASGAVPLVRARERGTTGTTEVDQPKQTGATGSRASRANHHVHDATGGTTAPSALTPADTDPELNGLYPATERAS